jgi:hypothetical protein
MTIDNAVCPMGCGKTLTVENDWLVCANEACPDRHAVAKLLQPDETKHIVVLNGRGGWNMRHPLHERLGSLFACEINRFMTDREDWHEDYAGWIGTYEVDVEHESGRVVGSPRVIENLVLIPLDRTGE